MMLSESKGRSLRKKSLRSYVGGRSYVAFLLTHDLETSPPECLPGIWDVSWSLTGQPWKTILDVSVAPDGGRLVIPSWILGRFRIINHCSFLIVCIFLGCGCPHLLTESDFRQMTRVYPKFKFCRLPVHIPCFSFQVSAWVQVGQNWTAVIAVALGGCST